MPRHLREAPPNETVSQREQRRKAQKEWRDAQQPMDHGLAGASGMVGADWLEDIIASFNSGALDDEEGREILALTDQLSPEIESKAYKTDELVAKLKALGLMIRMYASSVEGVPILNIGFDDITGEVVMDPTYISL